MSRISSKKRGIRLRIREKRKTKLAKLRRKYSQAKTAEEKGKIWAKASKVSPRLSQKEFLGSIKKIGAKN